MRDPFVTSPTASSEEGRQAPAGQVADGRPDARGYPASFGQERLWFLNQMEPESSFYNTFRSFRLAGPVRADALEESIHQIVARHDALRTTFAVEGGRLVQRVAAPGPFRLNRRDHRELPPGQRADSALIVAQEDARRPFVLSRGPLFRATLQILGDEEHVLSFTFHHIVFDGWSWDVFQGELSALYRHHVSGVPAILEPLRIQYPDFAVWQRNRLRGDLLGAELAYWKERLTDLPVLQIPSDRPRPSVQSFRGAEEHSDLSKELGGALEALSRREGVTLFMTLLAAFQVLLSRYCDQPDVAVGTPVAGRDRAEIEPLIGFFINMLVLRTDLSGNPTFRELMSRVREVALSAYSHQELPFEKLVEELRPERSLSHSPLFQATLTLVNAAPIGLDLGGVEATRVDVAGHTEKFDFSLGVIRAQDGLNVWLSYSTDLFDKATAVRLLAHFRTLLEAVALDPDRRVAELPLLTPPERAKLLVEWNRTESPYPAEHTVHEQFEAQVERTPDSVAVLSGEEQMTYRQLNARANRLAAHLRRSGVGPESLVGIVAKRSPDMVVALLGILKAGGAYMPLDPAYPEQRLAFMLEDSAASVVLAHRSFRDRLALGKARLVLLDDAEWENAPAEGNPRSGATPQNLAYVIYTSGSTGRPKGVEIPHQGVVNYLFWCTRSYPVAEGGGAPVHSSLSFDLTVTSLLAPLIAGRPVYLLPEEQGIEALSSFLQQKSGLSLVKITPAHLEVLSRQLPPQAAAGRARAFIVGGENLLAETAAFWRDFAPETALVNEYGPTETVVGCATYTISEDDPRSGSVPIGRPIANAQLYVLDRLRQPVPVGVPGELCVGGVGVARGYRNRPDLTAENFIPDPFRGGGGRLYRTGDSARYLQDGNLEFLGRLDDQIKLRGYRIELGEIEAALCSHPAVRESAVLSLERAPGDHRLSAYLVCGDRAAPGDTELRAFLRAWLPDYMIPSVFVSLDALPLTPNGKVDRSVLATRTVGSAPAGRAYSPPRSPEEEFVAGVWAQVLGLDRVGIHDNFFELGGHSLLAIQVFSRLEETPEMALPLRALFEKPTVAELGDEILRMRNAGSARRVPAIPARSREALRHRDAAAGGAEKS